MKTMKSPSGKIVRVNDTRATQLYEEGFKYLPKSEWKEEVRDVNKPSETTTKKVKSNNTSKAQKRQMRKTL